MAAQILMDYFSKKTAGKGKNEKEKKKSMP
jgi:hypothetical protein